VLRNIAMDNKSLVVVQNKDTGKLETVCLDTGEVISTEEDRRDLSRFKFNYETALLICQRVREGYTLKKLGDSPDLPALAVIHYWMRSNASFKEEMKMARSDRAEYYHDKVMEIADNTDSGEQVQVNKFKTDQYKWGAERGNPERYGNKTTIDGTIENKVSMIVLNTGISRKKPDIEVINDEDASTEQSGQVSVGDTGRVQADVPVETQASEEVEEESGTTED
jgi:hypothetical protein